MYWGVSQFTCKSLCICTELPPARWHFRHTLGMQMALGSGVRYGQACYILPLFAEQIERATYTILSFLDD